MNVFSSSLEENLAQHVGMIGFFYFAIVVLGLLLDLGLGLYWRARPVAWGQKISRLEWRPWEWRDLARLVLFLVALHVVLLTGAAPLQNLLARWIDETSFMVIAQSLVFHWAGLAFVVVLLARRRMPWKSAFGLTRSRFFKRLVQGAVFLLATMPVLLFYTLLYHVGLQLTGHEPQLQDVVFAISDETSTGIRIYFVLLATIIAPFFEEILFRGIALPIFAKRLGLGPAIILVAVIFAMIHGHVPSLVPLFLLSVALSVAYIYTESLWVSIVMHGLFNALTVTILMGFS